MKSKSPAPNTVLPVHDDTRSQAIEPYRHEQTGRTVGRIQDAGNGASHLFSATGLFIETVKTSTLAGVLPTPGAAGGQRGDKNTGQAPAAQQGGTGNTANQPTT